ncbi:MAG: tRNA 4-thiouridine(8) synthase ThiI [Kiritimatiellae bacterium]|nr:tRNA 4-thiouridine(8) synthase ThiI [Kiritimatiellia bacterium]
MNCNGLSLVSGGLDSQLAIRVLQRAGAHVEAVTFSSPFFDSAKAEAAAKALGVKLHIVDFLEDVMSLVENPPHGFGGAMNPCIDCHALMIRRAGELMHKLGFDFVSTGEVRGQRPMSQNAQSLLTVEKASGLKGRLVRPLSAKLLEPTIPEIEGKLDREKLLDISGRSRERQIALAAEFGITDYPSPAGGCKLTEDAYGRKLRDLMDHEGVRTSPGGPVDREMVELLKVGRRFRLPDGSGVILGRNAEENALLRRSCAGRPGHCTIEPPDEVAGPTALVPRAMSEADLEIARGIVKAWSRGTSEADRAPYKKFQLV